MNDTARRGALAAASAFFIWGLFPLFWSLFGDMPAVQLLAHRALWCAVAVWVVLIARRDLGWVMQLTPRLAALLGLGGVLISVNWGVYVWAVVSGHVIDTSLGYFITPLVSVLIAVVVLRERLTGTQRAAVAIAASGVLLLGWQLGHPPWVALTLAISFGIYGLVRKLAPFDALHGLAIESSVMMVPSALYLLWCEYQGTGHFLHGDWLQDSLLLVGGPLTAIPLVLFSWGARRVSLLSLGVMQYIAPSVALLLGIWVFHEPFDGMRRVAFVCIWVALALFTGEALRRHWPRGAGAGRSLPR